MTDDRGNFLGPHQLPTPTSEQLADWVRAMNQFIARHNHPEHTKDRVCLPCFNRRLMTTPWTFKPGERSIKVGRYVGQGLYVPTDHRAGAR